MNATLRLERNLAEWRIRPTKQHQRMLDMSILFSAFIFSYLLRFDFLIPGEELPHLVQQLPYVLLIQLAALRFAGVNSFIWRYVGIAEMKAFVRAGMISAVPVILLRLLLPVSWQALRVPLSVVVMDTILAFGGVLAIRILRRMMYETYAKRRGSLGANGEKKSVLLIGAGRAGLMTAREILQRGEMGLEIRGFVDDDPNKQGAVISGIPVLGAVRDLPQLTRGVDHVIISIAKASRREFRSILDVCEGIPIKARIIPSLNEILQGRLKLSRIRDIEVEDLLGREIVHLNKESLSQFISGKTLMVTGAGGSIGSELVRQIAGFLPSRLLLVERAEFALFNIQREVLRDWPSLNIVPVIADIGDERRMRSIFKRYSPEIVIHAAAHKHVPMMESNVAEAVKNNVLATRSLGELAGNYGVEVFVLISSDKAVRPSSVMGATKRLAELTIQNLNRHFETRYVAVRFGNVIGSAGSVIPIFREQIAKGGPVTVTHPDMTRYFMTIPEASQLVLQTGALGKGGEIFVLDMGAPVRIFDLAQDTISLSGLRPFEDIEIVFTGMRPGEKLFEELEMTEEHMSRTQHPKIFIGRIAEYTDEQVQFALSRLAQLALAGADSELRAFINDLLPEAHLEESRDEPTDGSPLVVSQLPGALSAV
jgi:FlaA1/EpsC-like NDP-sugar epimerase